MDSSSIVTPDSNTEPDISKKIKTKPKSSSKIILIVLAIFFISIIALFGIVAIAVSLLINNQTKKISISANPDQRIQDTFVAIANESNSKFSEIATSTNASIANPLSMLNPGIDKNFLGSNYNSALEVHTKGNADAFSGYLIDFTSKFNAKYDSKTNKVFAYGLFTLTANSGSVNFNLNNVDAQLIGDSSKIYVKEQNLPSDVFKMLTGSSETKNQIDSKWFSIDVNSLTGTQASTLSDPKQKQQLQDFSTFYKTISANTSEYKFFTNSKNMGTANVNGVQTTHFQTSINYDEVSRYMKYVETQYIAFDKAQSTKNGTKPSVTTPNLNSEIDNLISQFRSNVKINSLDLYLSDNDNKIYKYAVDMNLVNASQALTQVAGGDLNIKNSFEIVESNKAQEITIPTTALDITSTIKSLTQPMQMTKPVPQDSSTIISQ